VLGLVACLRLLVACGSAPSAGETLGTEQAPLDDDRLLELRAPDPHASDFFGQAVGLDRGEAIVGIAARDSVENADDDVGSAQLFAGAGADWAAGPELFPTDRVPLAELGWAVAIHGSTAALGGAFATVPPINPNDDPLDYAGLAYGFRKQSNKWLPEPLALDDEILSADLLFGYALAALDDEIFVGAPSAGKPGSAYVYHFKSGVGWGKPQILDRPAAEQTDDDGFGWAIAVTDDTLLVGAPGNPDTTGQVYVYGRSKSGWVLQQTLSQKLHAAQAGDAFGATLALRGDQAIVGALGNTDSGVAGAVYLFERRQGVWGDNYTHEFVSDAQMSFDSGLATAIGPDKIWIGIPQDRSGTVRPFTFQKDNWEPEDPLVSPTPGALGFGTSLAASGRSVLIGCPDDDRHYGSAFLASQAQGAVCESDYDCRSGHCVDQVCCDTACDSACFSCLAHDKGAGADGECGPVAADVDPPADDCPLDAATSCGNTGRCDGQGGCALAGTDTVCAAASCESSSSLLPEQRCDGAGSCAARPAVKCAPLSCRAGSCAPCRDDGDCQAGQFCGSDGCELKRELSEACSDGRECTSGMCPTDHCVDGPECSADATELVDIDGTRTACSPYVCRKNACRQGCKTSADCQDNFACTQSGTCEPIPTAQPHSSAACGFTPTRRMHDWSVLGLLLVAALRRRRRSDLAL
jgi:hypothetical protein